MINLKPHIPVGTRHKMLFISNEIEGVSFVDLGQELSKAIEPLLDKKRLPLLADDALERIITNNSVVDAALGDYVAIKNIEQIIRLQKRDAEQFITCIILNKSKIISM